MTVLGQIAVWLAVVLAAWGLGTGTRGAHTASPPFLASARRSPAVVAAVLAVAVLSLLAALVRRDVNVTYAAETINRALPDVYRVMAVAAAPAGALLVVALLVATFSAGTVQWGGARAPAARALVAAAALGVVLALTVVAVAQLPFARLPYTPLDGAGLPTGLRHPAFVVYTPLLLVGMACAALTFATGLAARLVRRGGASLDSTADGWARWTWFVLGAAAVLGAWWTARAPAAGTEAGRGAVGDPLVLAWLASGMPVVARVVRRDDWRRSVAGLPFAMALLAVFVVSDGGAPRNMSLGVGPAGIALTVVAAVVALWPAVLVWRRGIADAATMRHGGGTVRRWAAGTSLAGVTALGIATAVVGTGAGRSVSLGIGDTAQVSAWGATYTVRQLDVSSFAELDRVVNAASALLTVNGEPAGAVTAERRQFVDVLGRPLRAPAATAAIRRTALSDLSVTLVDIDDRRARYALRIHPLGWLMRGGAVLALLGAVLMLLPERRAED